MHGAHQHIHLVARHQLVGAIGALGRVGLVVQGHVFDVSAQRLALLLHGQLEAVGDGHAELREGARVGQHQTNLDLGGLRQRQVGQAATGCQQSGRAGGLDQFTALGALGVVVQIVRHGGPPVGIEGSSIPMQGALWG